MLYYHNINPIALQVGTFTIYWYGISYLLGFISAYLAALYLAPRQIKPWNKEQITDLLFYVAMGTIFGGKFGFILFYHPMVILDEPFVFFAFWLQGRSFHGGFLGVLIAIAIYAKLYNRTFLDVSDFIAPVIPIGLGFGRLGNFINGELWGRVTDLPWGVVFPNAGPSIRHPSQLYEFLLEGLLLFFILKSYSSKYRIPGKISGFFLFYYGVFRCLVEFFREPDYSHGFIAFNWLTMGQLLSIPMIFFGILLCFNKHVNGWKN